jgi:hypothetical protein
LNIFFCIATSIFPSLNTFHHLKLVIYFLDNTWVSFVSTHEFIRDSFFFPLFFLENIFRVNTWLLYLFLYIVEGYILYLIISYMSIVNYTISSPNMIGYRRIIPLWSKSVNFCDISWIPLISSMLPCIRCLNLFHSVWLSTSP